MKKKLLQALALVTVVSFNACSDGDLRPDSNAQEQLTAITLAEGVTEADASHQWEANEKLTTLIASFGTTENRFKEKIPDYPDYYGGAYVTPEGKAVVLIKGDAETGKSNVLALTGSGGIEFGSADYSFAELTGIMDRLNEFAINKENPAAQKNFNIFSLMDQQNRVVVELNEYSEAKIDEFKKLVLDDPAITFVQSKGELKLEVDLNPGCKADLNAAGTNFASYGFAARRLSDNALGMVTAGHAIGVGQTLYHGGVAIGVCSASQIAGSVDAAFIPMNNPTAYVPANMLCGSSNVLSTLIIAPLAGTTINKMGAGSGLTSGVVLNTNTTWVSPVNGNTLTNITSANYFSVSGDSGGTVYFANTITGINPTVGTHIGDLSGVRYFTKAGQITAAFGIVRH